MLESCRPATRAAIVEIMNTFTGADGGLKYVQFCSLLETLDRQAAAGDVSSERLVAMVTDFERLLNIPAVIAARKKLVDMGDEVARKIGLEP
jgi:hypothetical protein